MARGAGLACVRGVVPLRRRLHQLSLRAQSGGGPRAGLQSRGTGRGLHELPLGAGAGGAVAGLRTAAGEQRAVVVRGVHHWNTRGDGLVDGALARAAAAGTGRLDGAGAALHQRDIRRVDFRRWTGDTAVHLLRRSGRRLPDRSRRQSLGAHARLAESCRGRADEAGGAVDRGLLLRLVRCQRCRRFTAPASEVPRPRPAGSPFRCGGRGALPVPLRLLWRVAPEYLLRQACPTVVRVRIQLPVGGGHRYRALPVAAARVAGGATGVARACRPQPRAAAGLHRSAHGLCAAGRGRLLRVSAPGLLLAPTGRSRRRGDRSAGRRGRGRVATDPVGVNPAWSHPTRRMRRLHLRANSFLCRSATGRDPVPGRRRGELHREAPPGGRPGERPLVLRGPRNVGSRPHLERLAPENDGTARGPAIRGAQGSRQAQAGGMAAIREHGTRRVSARRYDGHRRAGHPVLLSPGPARGGRARSGGRDRGAQPRDLVQQRAAHGSRPQAAARLRPGRTRREHHGASGGECR